MRLHHLSLRTPQQTSLARIMGFNKQQAKTFFDNLSEVKKAHQFPVSPQYNMDETGLSTVPNCPPKVISSTGKKAVGKISSAERGELTTAVCAMSAAGNYVPPALIFKRKRRNPLLLKGTPPGSLLIVSDTGYINGSLFLEWLEHFQKEVKASKSDPVLLVLDNHSSHYFLDAVLYCRDKGIVMLSIPPHSSHKTQPLDRCFFKALKTAYSEACSNWLTTNPGKVITQYEVGELFGKAYCKCATVEKAVKAFETCGIEPLNPDVFTDEDFQPSQVTDIPQGEVSNAPSTSYDTPQRTMAYPKIDCAATICVAPDPLPSTSGTMSNKCSEEDVQLQPLDLSKSGKVSPAEIRPLPKRKEPQQRRKKGKKSEIITSSPVKDRLVSDSQKKEQRSKRLLVNATECVVEEDPVKAKVGKLHVRTAVVPWRHVASSGGHRPGPNDFTVGIHYNTFALTTLADK
nr:uncharacterized protein LOC115268161 [Aedes albopictus]